MIFSCVPKGNKHSVCAHIMSSSCKIHANKGTDTVVRLIMNAMILSILNIFCNIH